MGEAELGSKVREYLKDKKYLVAMDDVWSREVWSSLRSYLPEAKDGSKVLITTRNEEIALHATSQEEIAWTSLNSEEEIAQHANSQELTYRLRIMNDDESWRSFSRKLLGTEVHQIKAWKKVVEETLIPGLMSFSHHTYLYKVICWKELVCSSGGFLQLQSLELRVLFSLEELVVEEGALPHLKTLQIELCERMEKLPRGLLQLKNLEKVEPKFMFDRLIEEFEETKGED
ncbi:putative disease resistance protein [Vitis vinifera]|uniref:Putative disease resistance protein n=1 Tax=Vitis vinifera TaxID=29760 RepID=A0A438JM19_VITVI|nr:putative disease resistance protein [Vitis vinifera]